MMLLVWIAVYLLTLGGIWAKFGGGCLPYGLEVLIALIVGCVGSVGFGWLRSRR